MLGTSKIKIMILLCSATICSATIWYTTIQCATIFDVCSIVQVEVLEEVVRVELSIVVNGMTCDLDRDVTSADPTRKFETMEFSLKNSLPPLTLEEVSCHSKLVRCHVTTIRVENFEVFLISLVSWVAAEHEN